MDERDILIVDDNPDNLALLGGVLMDGGYRVRGATSGAQALKIAAARLPRLVLLDLQMPEMDGYELCRRLKAARVGAHLELDRLRGELERQNLELQQRNRELLAANERTERVFSALAAALPGTLLDGKYRLDEKIGSGGYATVFRGEHLELSRPVAVKVLRPAPGNDSPRALERFRAEGMSACRVNHLNAVRCWTAASRSRASPTS